jgi:hypothetical protein
MAHRPPGGPIQAALGASVGAAAFALIVMVIVASAQPLFTEDTWWHLAMGETYASDGPRLIADPLLHTASGPPAPAAWLADVALHCVQRTAGFGGLRIAHAAVVAAIFALAFFSLRRMSGSWVLAALGVALFAVLSAYRLFQLRPHLLTILAALLLLRALVEDGTTPSWRRVGVAGLLLALWVNLHAAFVLGLLLIGAAMGGLLAALPFRIRQRERDLPRIRRLVVALGACTVATFANPEFAQPHSLYFVSGGESPTLGLVVDEWASVNLLAWPVPGFPPSPLGLLVLWGLLIGTPLAIAATWKRERNGNETDAFDPALAGVALLALGMSLFAVRFTWMGIFALFPIAKALHGAAPLPTRWSVCLAAIAGLLIPGFAFLGPWPMISNGVHSQTYARAYPAAKYHAHATWFLRDTGLEGRLWNDYSTGNFFGYWLAPTLRVFINGSLNVPPDVMAARQSVRRREPDPKGWKHWLDRYDIDVFVGTGVPTFTVGRPDIATSAHLEQEPDWIPIFRNLRSGIYLRRNEGNTENLERVAAYYERAGVPFERETGFDAGRAIATARQWAFQHGLIPSNYAHLVGSSRSFDPDQRNAARDRLAGLYALLGLYDSALELDRARLQSDPGALGAARRQLWSQMRLRDSDASRTAAEALSRISKPGDARSSAMIEAATRFTQLPPAEATALAAVVPLVSPAEARWLLSGVAEPEIRPSRAP